ncbi:MAG: IS66 family transposase [Anaerolineae bacterium]|nr:IS66 family transposase [Anaerolineae bacterium]
MSKTEATLEQLNKEALIELVKLLSGRVRTLERRVEQLTGQAKPKKKVKKTPENSSIPPSQAQKGNIEKKPKTKRGPKFGHVGKSRHRVEPDEIIECRLEFCRECGHNLEEAKHWFVGRHQVIDIPPIKPIVREARRYRVTCPCCKKQQTAEYVEGFEKGRKFGENLEGLSVYLHYAHPLSYKRVRDILREMCSLTISNGGVQNLVSRTQTKVEQAAQVIHEQVKRSPVVGSDETGARVNGINHWQWVFQTPEWVYNVIKPSRSADNIHEVMEDAQPEVWVSDVLSSQMCHPAQQYQICLAHQVRDLQYEIDNQDCRWARDLQKLFYQSMKLKQNRLKHETACFQKKVENYESRLDQLLELYPNHANSERLRQRFVKHREALLLFLHRDDVPPTNNASEQALRNSVIYRKVTGGFRSDWGAELYANVISILETARRQGLEIFSTLVAILRGHAIFANSLSA